MSPQLSCSDTCKYESELHQPRLWFITGGYLVKCWFIPAAARARGQSNDLNRGILASNFSNCQNEVINAPPIPSISRCIHIVYRHKNVWEYQWSNSIYNCMSTFLHYVRCKDALLDCSAPGGERCESLTWVDEINESISYFGNDINVPSGKIKSLWPSERHRTGSTLAHVMAVAWWHQAITSTYLWNSVVVI